MVSPRAFLEKGIGILSVAHSERRYFIVQKKQIIMVILNLNKNPQLDGDMNIMECSFRKSGSSNSVFSVIVNWDRLLEVILMLSID